MPWHFNCGRPWQSSTGFHTIHPASVCSCTAGRTLPSLFVSCLAREGSGPSQCSLCAPDGLSVIPSPLSRSRTALEILSVFLSLCLSFSLSFLIIFHLFYAICPSYIYLANVPVAAQQRPVLSYVSLYAIARLPCTCLGARRLLNQAFHQDLCVNEKHGWD